MAASGPIYLVLGYLHTYVGVKRFRAIYSLVSISPTQSKNRERDGSKFYDSIVRNVETFVLKHILRYRNEYYIEIYVVHSGRPLDI